MNPELAQQLVEYVKVNDDLRADLMQKVASLEAECLSLKEGLTKTAEASQKISADQIERTVDNLIKAGQLKASLRKEASNRFMQDPALMLECIDKMAAAEIERKSKVPSLGRSVPVESMTSKTAQADSEQVWQESMKQLARYQG